MQVVNRDKAPPVHGLARANRGVPSVSAFPNPAAPYKQLAWRSAADSYNRPACGSSAAPAMQRPSTTDPPPAAVRPAAHAAHNIALGCQGLWRTSICAYVQAASGAQCPSTAAGTTPAVKAVLKANYPAAVFAAAANYAEDVRTPLLPGLPALHVLIFPGGSTGSDRPLEWPGSMYSAISAPSCRALCHARAPGRSTVLVKARSYVNVRVPAQSDCRLLCRSVQQLADDGR